YGVGEVSSASNSFIPLALPGVPQNVTATGGNTNITMTWAAPASNGGATITQYKATASSGQSCTGNGSSTGCTITGMTNNVSVTVTVYATNMVGDGPASSPLTVMPGFVPNAPTNAVAGFAATVATLAGQSSSGSTDGTGTAAKFSGPAGFDFDSAGNAY